jgi:hypothetical protein
MAGSPLIVLALLWCRQRTHHLERRRPAAFLADQKPISDPREETMIKTIVFALFGLALASAAQAMPFSPAYQPVWVAERVWSWSAVPAWPEPPCATRAVVRDGMVASALTTTKRPVISFKGESDMRKIALTGAIIVCCAAFSMSPLRSIVQQRRRASRFLRTKP